MDKREFLQRVIREYGERFAETASVECTDLNLELGILVLKSLGLGNHQNEYVSGEFFFLRRHLESLEHPVVLDVGANRGEYSVLVRKIAPSAEIHAFEPHPVSCGELKKAARLHRFTALNLALSDAEEELVLYDYEHSPGSEHASLYKGVMEEIHHSAPAGTKVRAGTVDAYLETAGINFVDLLKVDTEGHELAVLKGAEQSIRKGRIRALQLEFNDMHVHSRTFFKDIWDFLPEYDLYRLLPDGMVRFDCYNPLWCELFAFQNIVALRKG